MSARLFVLAGVGMVALGGALARAESRAPEGPDRVTIAAWDAFVAKAEPGLHSCRCDTNRPQGKTYEVPGGIIHQWEGSVFIRGVTVDEVVDALKNRGVPPPQDEVLQSRVLSRSGDSLVLYLQLSRSALVTVTYDTEHVVTFDRRSPEWADSRSIATHIEEVGGRDRGFLWRLNSYWRYVQEADGVRIQAESLSLSRSVPAMLKPAASPIINHIGRDSMTRSLESLRRFLEGATQS